MKHRILVVEDNTPSRELLCDWLEARGYEVVNAADLKTAFAAFENQRPDAVLLDIQLGAEDGLALARWLRQQPGLGQVPIISVTAHAMFTERKRILESGCDACLSKPLDLKLLQKELVLRLGFSGMTPPPVCP